MKAMFLLNKRSRMSAASQMSEPAYTTEFYNSLRGASRRSAEAVVPIILPLVQPKSIVDVGCGDGTWLATFRDFGVDDTVGLDGDYVDRRQLQIPQHQFRATDLSLPFGLPRTFDLAVSLEVAEHLPPQSAEVFVDSLTKLAPVVLFSAAIPLQGGTQHLNEQWPDYWAALFKTRGYLAIDCIRGRIWANERVEWYYAQNILLFAGADRVREDPNLQLEYEKTNPQQLAVVHPRGYLHPVQCGVRNAVRLLALATMNVVRRRV